MNLTLKDLRARAITSSLFPPTTLSRAVERLGFVQADPIRSPARAQDLILRPRVKDYRAGDLDRRYHSLGIEEDYVYAYGFVPQSTWRLLHPRIDKKLTVKEQQVLDIVSAHKRIHPRELEAYLGRKREVNAWGGYSKATTHILHRLHYRGVLRVAGRENGIRLYEAARSRDSDPIAPAERLRQLVLKIAAILAPLPERSLRETLRHLGYSAPNLEGRHSAVRVLLKEGALAEATVDGLRYVWPAERIPRNRPSETVRFLAPFDPLVWDRRRFEHFWGWAYRFEAYTPLAKRKMGYYAMPMLWRDEMIGWVNVSKADSVAGFMNAKPTDPEFQREFEAETARMHEFLGGASSPSSSVAK